MKQLALPFILSVLASNSFGNPIDELCPEHAYTSGAPVSSIETNNLYVCHLNYAVHYRTDTKTAEYVTYHVDLEDISGEAKRRDNFRQDDLIPNDLEATLEDYSGEPYDRGHLSAAADNSASAEMMSESFFLSNMVPQNPNQNRGAWRILEDRIRKLAKEMDLYITVGTIYEAGYTTIGPGKVGVPTYIWKIVTDADSGETIAFAFKNEPIKTADIPLTITTVEKIEEATGIDFHPGSLVKEGAPDISYWPGIVP